MSLRKIENILICLLLFVTAMASNTSADNSYSQSGPYMVSFSTTQPSSISVASPTQGTTTDGNPYTSYYFKLGSGAILIAEYQNSFLQFDPTLAINAAYSAHPGIENIEIIDQLIDGRKGAIAQAYSPKNGYNIYVADYLFDTYTMVIIAVDGDSVLFSDIIKNIHVAKMSKSSAAERNQVSSNDQSKSTYDQFNPPIGQSSPPDETLSSEPQQIRSNAYGSSPITNEPEVGSQDWYADTLRQTTEPVITDSWALIKDLQEKNKKDEERGQTNEQVEPEVVQSMLGKWQLPGRSEVEITEQDLQVIESYQKNAGVIHPLPVKIFMYALIKNHHQNKVLLPPSVMAQGLQKLTDNLNEEYSYYIDPKWTNSKALEFWADYITENFKDRQDFGTEDGIIADFHRYIDFRYDQDSAARSNQMVDLIDMQTDLYVHDQKVMQQWGEHLDRNLQWDSLSKAKRDAYLTQWNAEWVIGKSEEVLNQ
jgi:hypothetical protein